jgi:hypothetical protein
MVERSQLQASVPVALTPLQQRFLQVQFATFMGLARKRGIVDQDMCEWLTSIGVRWLRAHGVSTENVHAWVSQEMSDARTPAPLIASAASRNDFGGKR